MAVVAAVGRHVLALGRRGAGSCSTSSAGIAVGLAVGYIVRQVRRRIDNPPVEMTIALLTGYFAFLPADGAPRLGRARGRHGRRLPRLAHARADDRPDRGCRATRIWEILTFLLNALLFVLLGLQLRPMLDALSGTSVRTLIGDAR